MKSIYYGRHTINKSDVNEVLKILKSESLTQGKEVNKFENNLKKYFGARYCVAVSSGTSALYSSLQALNFSSRDIVITTPITFLATGTSIIHAGYKIFLSDINLKNFTLDPNILEVNLKKLKKKNLRCKAVIGVDYGGTPCDWKSLKLLSKKYKFLLINDNCHAMGTEYFGSKKYAAKYADIVIHSYHPVKTITTGEGGSVITNNKDIFDKVKLYRSHGIVRNKKQMRKFGQWFYDSKIIGYNFRMTDFQAALGTSQLKKINYFIRKRRKIAKFYERYFSNTKKIYINREYGAIFKSSYHLFTLLFNFKKNKISKINFFNKMKKNNIILQVHYNPLHKINIIKKYLLNKNDKFKNSEFFFKNSFSIPIYPNLKMNSQKYVLEKVNKFLKIK